MKKSESNVDIMIKVTRRFKWITKKGKIIWWKNINPEINKWLHELSNNVQKEFQDNGMISDSTVHELLMCVSNRELWDFFCKLIDIFPMSITAMAKGLKQSWVLGAGDYRAFVLFREVGLEQMLEIEQNSKAMFDSLPDKITIYRGCNKEEANIEDGNMFGPSWTLKREVAEFFAFRDRQYGNKDGRVYSIVINKHDMSALFLDRGEFEVVYIGALGDDEALEMVTDKPTVFYDTYMKQKEEKRKIGFTSRPKMEEDKYKII